MSMLTPARTISCLLVLGLVGTAPKMRLQLSASPPPGLSADLIFVQAPVVAADLPDRFPEGSRLVRLVAGNRASAPATLTPEFFAAADPRVSFDGKKVLFAGQKNRGDRWQVWEMNSDGSEKHQLTRCNGDCLRPAYLPRDEIVFTIVTKAGSRLESQLAVSKRDGSNLRQITFGPGNFQVETALQNGLILVSGRSPLVAGGEAEESRQLYTLRIDGTGLASFRCDHSQDAVRGQAEEMADGSVVFVKSAPTHRKVGGELAQIRRGALHNSLLSPLHAISWSPRRLSPERLVVARKNPSPRGVEGKFDLYAFDSRRGKFEELIYQDPKLSSLQAVPVAAHPAPRWYWSTLNPQSPAGYFICLDSYASGDAARGRLSTPIASVRIISLEAATNQEHSLGEAPVEQDGSFYIAVPPDRPIRFELLDASGKVIRAQRSWIWARPGEERGCVGCHEDKAVAPPNRWPLALQRFDTPTRLGVENGTRPAH